MVVPDDIARSLGSLTDLDGRPMVDSDSYRDEWNESFSFDIVGPDAMTPGEQETYDRIRSYAPWPGSAWPSAGSRLRFPRPCD